MNTKDSKDEEKNKAGTAKADAQDSFNMPVQKSPWLIYALLQIPLVIIMVIIVYFMYRQSQG